jgi:hypothetical protein
MTNPIYRLMEGTGYCRVCDKRLVRGVDSAVYWYSRRNRGQSIYVCAPCVKLISASVEDAECTETQSNGHQTTS